MNDFENLLAHVMREHDEFVDSDAAGDPSEPHGLSVAASSPRRRPRVVVLAAAAAAVLAVAGAGVALGHGGPTHRAATGPTSPASSAAAPTPSAAPPTSSAPLPPIVWTGTDRTGATTTYRAVRQPLRDRGEGHILAAPVEWRGLSISMYPQTGPGTCNPYGVFAFGEGTSHYPQDDSDDTCTQSQRAVPDLDSIVLGPDSGAGMIDHSAAKTAFVVDGAQAHIGTVKGFTYVWVPSRHVVASLLAGSVAQVEAYIGSVAVESQSSTKCPLTTDPNSAPVNTREGTDSQMVPAGAVEASFCSYQGTELSFSKLFTNDQPLNAGEIDNTITGLNALTQTTSPARPSNDLDLRIIYRYASGPPVEVLMHMTDHWNVKQYTNGHLTRYGSYDAIDDQPI